jgi:hypothetical protein
MGKRISQVRLYQDALEIEKLVQETEQNSLVIEEMME